MFVIYSRPAILSVLGGFAAMVLVGMIPYLNIMGIAVGGGAMAAVDIWLRREEWPDSMFSFDQGGHIFFIPAWLIGVVIAVIGFLPLFLLFFAASASPTTN